MKTHKIVIKYLLVTSFLFIFSNNIQAQFTIAQKLFAPNNTSTYFVNSGIFNQNIAGTNTSGFMWPKGSNKYAIFTTGLNIAAFVHDSLRMAAASYKGEYRPGYTTNGIPYTDTNFRIYCVKRGDNSGNNPDYANWGAMVSFGAPYYDVNHNGQYDPGIDVPGVRNAEQTIFVALTDGFIESHSATEGFGGGTLPLYADLRITAWGYSISGFENTQFVKFQIINKNVSPWVHTFSGLFADPDLGYPSDDYIGCDTGKKLAYCYNVTNNDAIYGSAPPAVGFILLKGLVNHNTVPNNNIGFTSFIFPACGGCGLPQCEWSPADPALAYRRLNGLKNDGTHYLNPLIYPHPQTKFIYTGDPETNTGWNNVMGHIGNCGSDTGSLVVGINDARILMNMGDSSFTMAPNDTQNVYFAQYIARGTSNINSVTKLKSTANLLIQFSNSGFKTDYSVSGNIKYLDNHQNVTSGSVKAYRLDNSTGLINTLDSSVIQPDGSYTLTNVPMGDCYIGAVPNSTTQTDYVMTYFPSSIYYQGATLITISENISGINVLVIRKNTGMGTNIISGKITLNISPYSPIKDANIYAKMGNAFYGYTTSNSTGNYSFTSLPTGSYKIIVDRIGFSSDSISISISKSIMDSVNFHLSKLYVGINQLSNEIPDKYLLYQNYPNPFNPVTNIRFQIKESKFVVLKVFNVLGKEIKTLINEKLKAGIYEVPFNCSALPSGIYFYRLVTDSYSDTKRMVLIK